MTPYPAYYIPPDLPREKIPNHLPFIGGCQLRTPCGPDGKAGHYFGSGDYDPEAKDLWSKVDAGWYIRWSQQRPQNLIRLAPSPRIMRWHGIEGHTKGDYWRIPVLLTPMDPSDPDNEEKGYVSALDRIWAGSGWEVPPDLLKAQEALLCIMMGAPLHANKQIRTERVMELIISILSFGHHVSDQEIINRRWMTESMPAKVVAAATDRIDLIPRAAPTT